MKVKVGCCGSRASLPKYSKIFKLLEVQKTFYQLPRGETLSKWRISVPPEFEFVVKAWQAITHPPESPTWRKSRIDPRSLGDIGLLKPSPDNLKAWSHVVEACRVLRAEICLIQTPPSFKCDETHVGYVKAFFAEASKSGLKLAWEPRGDWNNNAELVEELCKPNHVIHVVDLLRRSPSYVDRILYTRLHGLNPREYDYKYQYSERELECLSDRLRSYEGVEEVYVLFNNVSMMDDAYRFQMILRRRGLCSEA